MAPRTKTAVCEKCFEDLSGEEPKFWVLVKSREPYLLPFYYCDSCVPNRGHFESEQEADLALITYLLTR